MRKRAFDINTVVRRIRKAVAGFPDAAMFALREQGYGTVFQQLVACIISIRTTDEVSLPTALALLKRAPSPKRMLALEVREIDRLIRASSFHGAKAMQIHAIARRADEEFDGELPAEQALARVLPKRYWIEINRLLVPFGKHVCTGVRPKCSVCPVLEYCRQVGVTEHR